PGPLRRRVRLGADPDVMFGGLDVDGFHHLARLVGQRTLRLGGCGGGHDVFSLKLTIFLDVRRLRRAPRRGESPAMAGSSGSILTKRYSLSRQVCNRATGMPGLQIPHLPARKSAIARVNAAG